MNFEYILMYVLSYFGLFTAIFFLLTLFENRDNLKNPKPKRYPFVSVIVPAFNEENTIAETLLSLIRLKYPKNKYEVIVVDDGSTDATYDIVQQFIDKHQRIQNIRLFKKVNGGKGSALNFGLDRCKGEFVGALDADSFVTKDALLNIIGYFENEKVMAVTPALKVYKPQNIIQKIQTIEYLMGIFLRKIFSFLGAIHVTPGPFTIYRKRFFEMHGKYDQNNLTEDIEIALRIQTHRYIIENSADAIVYTVAPKNFQALLKQRLRWYVGFISNVQEYKHLFSAKFGNLGIFILPAAFISSFLVIVTMFYWLYKLIADSFQNIINYQSINFDLWKFFKWNFDIFYVNFNSIAILALMAFLAGILIIGLAKILSKEKSKITFFYLFYLVFYWFLYGLWWFLAGIYKITGKKIQWGHKTL
jgi:cellulose synthase/poly-beta-1,6-N-acetylglucosamine synthase-like glycosyltransferase